MDVQDIQDIETQIRIGLRLINPVYPEYPCKYEKPVAQAGFFLYDKGDQNLASHQIKGKLMAKTLKSLLTWLGIVVAQWIGANLCVFLFSFVWYSEHPTSLTQFLTFVAFIGAGFLIGVYGVGMLILRWRRPTELLARTRFITTLVCIALPLLALAIIGWQITLGDRLEFQNEVIGRWQPNLAQTALWLSILGFHLPGWLKRRTVPVEQIKQGAFK